MTLRAPAFSEYIIEETSNDYNDVIIILSDEPTKVEYHLHKVLLAAHSQFFRKLFYRDPKKKYEIGSVHKKEFGYILGYIYQKELPPLRYFSKIMGHMGTLLYLGCEEIIEKMESVELIADSPRKKVLLLIAAHMSCCKG